MRERLYDRPLPSHSHSNPTSAVRHTCCSTDSRASSLGPLDSFIHREKIFFGIFPSYFHLFLEAQNILRSEA